MDRLLEDPQTSKFASEEKYCGINVESLKAMCRERNLQVTGVKFDLVLRILHCDNNSTPEGATLKRAATDVITTVDSQGQVVAKHVPKKRKKSAPSASKIYTRVDKKIESVKQKKYQSHYGSKTHSPEVYDLVASILRNDIIKSEESYLTKDPRFALTIAESACTSLTENFYKIQRPGYDDFGSWSMIDDSLRRIVEAAMPILSAEEKESTAEWIEGLHHVGDDYGLTMYTDLLKTAEYVRGVDAASAEEDNRKPAAEVKEGEAVNNVKTGHESAATVNENVANPSVM